MEKKSRTQKTPKVVLKESDVGGRLLFVVLCNTLQYRVVLCGAE